MKLEFARLNGGGARWLARSVARWHGGSGRKEQLRSNKIFEKPTTFLSALSQPPRPKKKMVSPAHIRSLYRSMLREIPHRPLSAPSQIQQRIRSSFTSPIAPPDGSSHHTTVTQQVAEGEEYLRYATAQRMYTVLLERYNPGIGSMMDEDERTRLTARRVGINLPEEYDSTSR